MKDYSKNGKHKKRVKGWNGIQALKVRTNYVQPEINQPPTPELLRTKELIESNPQLRLTMRDTAKRMMRRE